MTDTPAAAGRRMEPWDDAKVLAIARGIVSGLRHYGFPDPDDERTTEAFMLSYGLIINLIEDMPVNAAGATALYADASPTAVNGLPFFLKAELIPAENAVPLVRKVQELHALLHGTEEVVSPAPA